MTYLRIAIIGSGVVGASLAWHLARRGASVRLFDEGAGPASGVTGRAFGWINSIDGSPGADPVGYRLLRQGVEEYRRLAESLPGALADVRSGSLVWLETAEQTEALVAAHSAAGATVELVDAVTIARWEPRLRAVPSCAAFSPDDLALSPAALTQAFAKAAADKGAAMSFGETVLAIEVGANGVTGVRTKSATFPADIVVLAAGAGTRDLALSVGEDIGLQSSPAVLLRYFASRPFISRILRGPGLEIRQWHDHSLFVAKGYRDGEQSDALGRRVLEEIRKRFDAPDDISLMEAVVGQRPTFPDGLPRLGFLPGIEGVYVAVGHPGIILAPLIGRLAAEEIIGGAGQSLIATPGSPSERT